MTTDREHPTGPSVLSAPLFHVTGASGTEALSLPALLARLLAGPEIHAFPNLAAEQRGYVWRFLVRCAAKALRELGTRVEGAGVRSDLVHALTRALADLAPTGAWELYQSDPTRPGFLQAPTPDGDYPGEKNNYRPNPIGFLSGMIGLKNHERKVDVVRSLTAEQTVFALVEYQTAAIYKLKNGYESQLTGSRDGAGSGTPFMGAYVGGSNVQTFSHDVEVTLRRWDEVAHSLRGSTWALWSDRWDGTTQVGSEALDPAFIPFARLVRLAPPEGDRFVTVLFRPTFPGVPRVLDHMGGGNLGDPFTPLVTDLKDETTFKVRGTLDKGYDYAEVAGLLFGQVGERGTRPSPSVQALRDADDGTRPDLAVLFEGVAYEQGKTGGFHRRLVLLPPGAVDLFAEPNSAPAARAREANAEMLKRVKDARGAVRGAARIYMTGEPGGRDADLRADRAAAALEPRVDAVYLEYLVANARHLAAGDETWTWRWGAELRSIARDVFRDALPTLPLSIARRFERETGAWSYLEFRLAQLADPSSVLGTGARPQTPEEIP